MKKFLIKYKKYILVLCLAVLCIAGYNYDKVSAKIFKILPESVNVYLAEQYLPDKFWLHRTNSVNKQYEFADKYKGIEFDIIYHADKDVFENSHDEENAAAYNLEKQFEAYNKIALPKGIWLDFKNLNEDNKINARKKLNELITKYNIDKNLIWVESDSWQSLKYFKEDNFKTSYYFPYYDLRKMSDKEKQDIRLKTQYILQSGNVDAISFSGNYYDFIKSIDCPPQIVYLSWLAEQKWGEVLLNKKFKKINLDDRVKVILVRDKGNYHR